MNLPPLFRHFGWGEQLPILLRKSCRMTRYIHNFFLSLTWVMSRYMAIRSKTHITIDDPLVKEASVAFTQSVELVPGWILTTLAKFCDLVADGMIPADAMVAMPVRRERT